MRVSLCFTASLVAFGLVASGVLGVDRQDESGHRRERTDLAILRGASPWPVT